MDKIPDGCLFLAIFIVCVVAVFWLLSPFL